MNAGLILANAVLSQADQNTIANLTDDEVTALINVFNQVPADFLQRNCSVPSTGPAQGVRTIGIVF